MTASCWASSIRHPPLPHCPNVISILRIFYSFFWFWIGIDLNLHLHFSDCPLCWCRLQGNPRTSLWRRRCKWWRSKSWWIGRWRLWMSGCHQNQIESDAFLGRNIIKIWRRSVDRIFTPSCQFERQTLVDTSHRHDRHQIYLQQRKYQEFNLYLQYLRKREKRDLLWHFERESLCKAFIWPDWTDLTLGIKTIYAWIQRKNNNK